MGSEPPSNESYVYKSKLLIGYKNISHCMSMLKKTKFHKYCSFHLKYWSVMHFNYHRCNITALLSHTNVTFNRADFSFCMELVISVLLLLIFCFLVHDFYFLLIFILIQGFYNKTWVLISYHNCKGEPVMYNKVPWILEFTNCLSACFYKLALRKLANQLSTLRPIRRQLWVLHSDLSNQPQASDSWYPEALTRRTAVIGRRRAWTDSMSSGWHLIKQ